MNLVVIPARGGSKGIPGKNIKDLCGKPLIQYTLEAARSVFEDDEILVSTDDQEIKKTVEKIGLKVPFLRPDELATDFAGSYEVLLHALEYFESNFKKPEKVILLQPTSPFRTGEHIRKALKSYQENLDMMVSVKKAKANPYFLLKEENAQGFLEPSKKGTFIRRQDCPEVWELNGAIYIINPDSLKKGPISEFQKIKKYVMDDLSSVDIDTKMDWFFAEFILKSSKLFDDEY